MIKISEIYKQKTIEKLKDIANVNTLEYWEEELKKLSDEVEEIKTAKNRYK